MHNHGSYKKGNDTKTIMLTITCLLLINLFCHIYDFDVLLLFEVFHNSNMNLLGCGKGF